MDPREQKGSEHFAGADAPTHASARRALTLPAPGLRLLIWARLRSWKNNWRSQRGLRRSRPLVFVFLWVWIGALGYEIFRGVLALDASLSALRGVLGGMFLGFFVLLFFGGGTLATNVLLLSGETKYLLSTPVPRRTLFRFLLLETGILNSGMVLAFAPAFVIALGFAAGASAPYYPFALALAFAFIFAVTDLGVLLSLAIARALPPKRARELLSAFTGLSFLAFWIGLEWLRRRVAPTQGPPTLQSFQALRDSAAHFTPGFLPSTWVALGLIGALKGRYAAAAGPLLLVGAAALLLHESTARLADSLWQRGLAETLSARERKRTKAARAKSRSRSLWGWFVHREVKTLVRDYEQLLRVFLLALFAVAIPFLSRPSGARTLPWWYPLLFPFLFGSLTTAQFAAMLVALEGRAFWIVKLAPGGVRRTVLAKWLVSTAVGSILFLLFLVENVMLVHDVGLSPWLLPAAILVASALASFGLLIGARYTRFDWGHPKQMLRSPGGLLLALGAGAAVIAILGPPIALATLMHAPPGQVFLFLNATGAAAALAGGVACITPAIRHLQKLEWTL